MDHQTTRNSNTNKIVGGCRDLLSLWQMNLSQNVLLSQAQHLFNTHIVFVTNHKKKKKNPLKYVYLNMQTRLKRWDTQ